MPLPAIAAGALKIGAVLGKAAGATVKGVAAGAKTMGKAGKSAAKGTKSFGKSLSNSTGTVKKAISNSTKSTKKITKSVMDWSKKKKQKRDRRKAEENLEKSNQAKKKVDPKKSIKGSGNPLKKIIDFLATVVIGWVVVNLPKIVEFIKNFIEKIKGFLEKFKEFFAGIGDFLKDIGKFIRKSWDAITNLKFEDAKEVIGKALGGLKDGFTNLISKIGEGLGLLKKKEKEDPKKIAKDGNLFSDQGPQEVEGSPDTKKINAEIDKSGKDSSKSEKEFKGKLEELESIDFEKELSGESGDKGASTATEKLIPDHGSTDKKKIDVGKAVGGKVSSPSTGTETGKKVKPKDQTLTFPEGAFDGKDSYTGTLVPTEDKSELSISKPQTQSTTSITPERKGQDVVILDQEAPPPVPSSPNTQSVSMIILEKNSLNTLMKQQFLSELAYT